MIAGDLKAVQQLESVLRCMGSSNKPKVLVRVSDLFLIETFLNDMYVKLFLRDPLDRF